MISLPIINGAGGQHLNNPYFPVPFSPGMLQGAADAQFPQLLPRITLADGSVLMPLAYFKDVKVERKGSTTEVRWRQDALDLMGENNARADTRVSIVTRYVFTPGHISRRDTVTATKPVKRVDVEFATFSKQASVTGASVAFGQGEVSRFSVQGYDACAAKQIQTDPYRATTGPFNSLITCTKKAQATPTTSPSEITIGWDLSYNMRKLR